MEQLTIIENNIHSFQKNIDNTVFAATRAAALTSLKSLGFPTRRTENYKYTNLKPSFETNSNFSLLEDSNIDTKKYNKEGFVNLFCVNGILFGEIENLSITKIGSDSLEIINRNNKGLEKDFLYKLNQSTINNGYHFHFNKEFSSDLPIMIHHILDTKTSGIYNFSNTFQIDSGVKAEIIECYHTHNTTAVFSNFSSNIIVEENAKFIHIHHQDINSSSTFVNNIRSQVSRNANYESFTVTLGSKLSRNNIHIDLNAEGANCMAHGVYTLQNEQHSDIDSYINHKAPHTESAQLYKGIMSDKSRGVFTGLIKVDRDAQLINSNQLNKNLILNKGAHANSRPQLEIFADDVKCAHGSTTGQLSDAELFYFESRGIRPEKARMMLSHAFTYDVLLKIDNKNIRNYIQQDIVDKFEKTAFEVKDA